MRVDGSSVENGGQSFLVFDEGFERAHRHVKMIEEVRALLKGKCLVAWRYAGVGRARGFDVGKNKSVCGSEICLATLDECSCVRLRLVGVRHSGANRLPRGKRTRGRGGGTGTLDDLGDPVNPTPGGKGRAGSLDAQPGALEFGPG